MKHGAGIRSASLWVTLLIALCGQAAWSQQAIINEWSQGNGGAREWVEILVVQDGLDVRGFKLTNGINAASDGLVFNSAFSGWSSVPAGTLIVIYNGNSRDLNLPPDDLVVTGDGNWAVVAPHNNRALFSSGAWQTFPDTDNTAGPRLWNSANVLVHDWDQGDAPDFTALYPSSGYAVAYRGVAAGDISDYTKWYRFAAGMTRFSPNLDHVTPGKGSGGDNTRWIASLRGSGPLVETSLDAWNFGIYFPLDNPMKYYEVTGYNLATSITVSLPPNLGFQVFNPIIGAYSYSTQLDRLGGKVLLRFNDTPPGLYTATVTNTSGLLPPATVTLTAARVLTNSTNPNDVIINEFVVGDDGTTPYASLNGATITGDWAELLVVKDNVDLNGWVVEDKNAPNTNDEGVVTIPYNPALSSIPKNTVVLLVFGASTAPEDLDFSDGKMVLKQGGGDGEMHVWPDFGLDPAGDNLVLTSMDGGNLKPIDYIGSLQTNPSSALDPNPSSASEWGLTFQPDFPPIPSNEGCWFSVDAQGGFNNDDGSNTYNTLGYGWNVLPDKSTFTPGALNPGQAFATIEVNPSSLDFGAISPNASKVLPLEISNAGTIALEINASSAITGYDARDYQIEPGQLPLLVEPNQSSALDIRFSPNGDIGLLNHASLLLAHNASSANSFLEVPLSGSSVPGISELLFYEPFNYEAGPLTEISGGTWQHAAGNPGNLTVPGTGSLEYPGLKEPIGNKLVIGRGLYTPNPKDEDALRQFELMTPPATGEKAIYASMLVRAVTAPLPWDSPEGDYFCHFYDGSSGFGFRGRLYARSSADGTSIQFGLKFSGYGDPVFAPITFAPGTTVFLVMKLTMVADSNPGQNDRVELFINPNPAGAEPSSTIVAPSPGYDHDIQEGIGAFGLRQGESTPEAMVDEIRVGGTWASVTINSTPPYLAVNKPLWLPRGATKTITQDLLLASDFQTPSPLDLTYTLTSLPAHGILRLGGLQMDLSSRNTFTQYDIHVGRLEFRQDGSFASDDCFTFTLSDPDGKSMDGIFYILIQGKTRAKEWNLYK